MYAAENASIEVILLLVNAGANLDAKDSDGQGIDSYFAKNCVFLSLRSKRGFGASLRNQQQIRPPFLQALSVEIQVTPSRKAYAPTKRRRFTIES